jgi:hypothetical protein
VTGVSKDDQPQVPFRFNGKRSNRMRRATGLYIRSPKGLARRAALAQVIVLRMRKRMDWLQDSDLPVARQWADLEVLRNAIVSVLEQDGVTNNTGVPHRLLTELRWITNSQLFYSRDLGMTPAARAAIKASSTSAALDLVGALSATRNGQTQDEQTVE